MAIMVTGGAGYIGSHTVVLLQEAGHEVVVFDNLCNSHSEVFNRINQITGIRPVFVEGDIRDKPALREVFAEYNVECVIHFAGLKAVSRQLSCPV